MIETHLNLPPSSPPEYAKYQRAEALNIISPSTATETDKRAPNTNTNAEDNK